MAYFRTPTSKGLNSSLRRNGRQKSLVDCCMVWRLQSVCSVVHTWSETRSGHRRLWISSGCASRHFCMPGWTNWWYTGQNGYNGDSDYDYDDDNRFLYAHNYKYITTHQSCSAASCRHQPTGKLVLVASLNTGRLHARQENSTVYKCSIKVLLQTSEIVPQ